MGGATSARKSEIGQERLRIWLGNGLIKSEL